MKITDFSERLVNAAIIGILSIIAAIIVAALILEILIAYGLYNFFSLEMNKAKQNQKHSIVLQIDETNKEIF